MSICIDAPQVNYMKNIITEVTLRLNRSTGFWEMQTQKSQGLKGEALFDLLGVECL